MSDERAAVCQDRKNCSGCPYLEDKGDYWYCSARDMIAKKENK